jgi:adenine phosphoribosyltransferase
VAQRVPDNFTPPRDAVLLNETIGSRIHQIHGHSPDKWFPRQEQIVAALHELFDLLNKPQATISGLRVFPDFPKMGVSFADLFSLTVQPDAMRRVLDGMAARIDYLKRTCPGKLVLVGLESRGLMLGFALAMQCGLPFIPARKPGKLPGKTFQVQFAKEYGADALEIQSEYVGEATHAIIVDDIVATGGSIEAAHALCKMVGLQIALVLALADIPPLRTEWRSRLASIPVALLCA